MLTAYPCPASKWTIGYGSTRDVVQGMTIGIEEAHKRLLEDVSEVDESIRRLVKVALNQNQWDALADFTFNLGATKLKTSTLLSKLNQGLYDSSELLRWVYVLNPITYGWNKSPGLIRRRKAERDLFDAESLLT